MALVKVVKPAGPLVKIGDPFTTRGRTFQGYAPEDVEDERYFEHDETRDEWYSDVPRG